MEHIDLAALQELQEVMEDEYNQLVETFIRDSEQRIAAMDKALLDQDAEQMRELAHSLKGSCLNMFITPLAQQAREIENLAREQQLEPVSSLIAGLQQEFKTVSRLLKETLTD
ncbi:Hpt domain-containing protein [Zooshikella sp. RANM57]|uniref:Hpt domain-containing protein n=1 Tax=Zooshikella sp. RANM57 TaxID=3425863 RepID=UPI003D6F2ECF